MTIKNLLLLLVFGLAISACGNAGSGGEEGADTEEMTEDSTAMAQEEDMQEEEDKSQRKSPPMTAEGQVGDAQVTVNYGAPSVRGRTIYGDLVPYNEIWRTGANEATTIEISQDVMVEGEPLPAGKYALFTIPSEESWTVIFNEEADQWGAYDYDEAKDALRVEVTPNELEESVEVLEFAVEDGQLVLRWDNMEVPASMSAAAE